MSSVTRRRSGLTRHPIARPMDGTRPASRDAATIETPPCTKAAFAASSNGGVVRGGHARMLAAFCTGRMPGPAAFTMRAPARAPLPTPAPMLLNALTIFASAFLLFLVQPIVAKQILPWFGGSAAVWATCLVFFQTTLLLGYAYADFTVRRLTARTQVKLHVALLVLSIDRAADRAGCVLEAGRRRESDLAHPRHARRHDRPALLPAVDDESARAGVVRAALPGPQYLPAVRAVEPRFADRAAGVPVPARAVGRDPDAGVGLVRRATRCSSAWPRRPRSRA